MSRSGRNFGLAVFASLYGVWFFRMARYGLHSWFSEDDLLNLSYSTARPLGDLIRANFLFFSHYNRPLGQLLLYGLYARFGFNPGPFNVVRLVLCMICLVVLYLFVSRIAGSREAGILSVLLMGFHPALRSLYYESGMYFDVLAFLFYYLAFWLYMRDRRSLWVLLPFVAALDSKEIAVSLPVALLLYELVVARERRYRTALITGVLTLIYAIGKMTGPGALGGLSAYHPQISLSHYLDNYAHYAAEFTFLADGAIRPVIAFVLAGCIGLALAMRNRVMIWASLFNLVAILPIAFIPPRNGFAFFVPLAGWAVYMSILLVQCREIVTRHKRSLRAPAQIAVAAALCWLVLRPEVQLMDRDFYPAVHKDQFMNRDAWNSLKVSLPQKPGNMRVLALREPFVLEYALYFLLRLGYRDPAIQVDTVRLLTLHNLPVLPGQYDAVIDYADGQFFRVK